MLIRTAEKRSHSALLSPDPDWIGTLRRLCQVLGALEHLRDTGSQFTVQAQKYYQPVEKRLY